MSTSDRARELAIWFAQKYMEPKRSPTYCVEEMEGKISGALQQAAEEARREVAPSASGDSRGADVGFKGRIAARIDEYKFVAQMISGVEKEGWYKRRLAHLQEMYDQAGPQDARKECSEHKR